MLDPYLKLKQNINKLERIQCQAARFITKDCKSREPGCIEDVLKIASYYHFKITADSFS